MDRCVVDLIPGPLWTLGRETIVHVSRAHGDGVREGSISAVDSQSGGTEPIFLLRPLDMARAVALSWLARTSPAPLRNNKEALRGLGF